MNRRGMISTLAAALGLAPAAARASLLLKGAGSSGGGASAIAAPFTSVNANGWSAEYASQPTIPTPVAFDVTSPSYDASGVVTTLLRRLYVNAPVMQAWPTPLTQSASTAALSHYVGASCVIAGGKTNNSTAPYPPVVARWSDAPKQLLGAGRRIAFVAFQQHSRSKLPIRAGKITGTPTTGSAVTKTAVYEKSSYYADNLPDWGATFADSDFPSNGNANVTFTFEAFPWIGEAAAIRNTTAGTFPSATALAPEIYQTVGPTVLHAVVDNVSGNDGTAATSSTYATAYAAPYLTINAALAGIFAASSNASFCVVTCKNSGAAYTWDGTAPTGATRTAPDGWLTIRGDPADGDPYNNIVVQTSTTTYKAVFNNANGTMAWLKLQNIGLTIAATFQGFFSGATGRGTLWLDRVKFTNNLTTNTTWLSGVFGLIVTECAGTAGTAAARVFSNTSTNMRPWLIRGSTTNRAVTANCILTTTVDGSTITGSAVVLGDLTSLAAENLIAHNVKVTSWQGTTAGCFIINGSATTQKDACIVQCELICSNTATNPGLAIGENDAIDKDNVWFDYLTVRGGTDPVSGRFNIHNDPTTIPTTAVSDQAVYTNFACSRSLHKWIAVKDDVFHGDNEADSGAGFLISGWAKRYGVGQAWTNSENAANLFPPNYAGFGSTRATATTYDGSGRPTAGAPLIGTGEENQALTWDIDGIARRTDGTGAAGVREAP